MLQLAVLFFILSASSANVTSDSDKFTAALQLQDTVRSSLRSEDTAKDLRTLSAETKAAVQKLTDTIDTLARATETQGRATEKSIETLARATEQSIETLARAPEQSFDTQARAQASLEKSVVGLMDSRTYLLGMIFYVVIPSAAVFFVVYPQRVISMMRAFAGQFHGQHPPAV